jgi:molecular chaperone DnaJ
VIAATHYQQLGVAPTATTDEIRSAYRGLARRLHPDRAGASSSGQMAAVNQAWFVLSDPGRRAIYDASLRARPSSVAAATPWPPQGPGDLDDDAGFVPMRHTAARFGIPLPWLLVVGALAVIFVFTAYAVRPKGGGGGGQPDGVLEVGSCVTVAAVGAVVETGCDTPHEGRVVAIPSNGLYCADGAEAYADGDTRRVVCVHRG